MIEPSTIAIRARLRLLATLPDPAPSATQGPACVTVPLGWLHWHRVTDAEEPWRFWLCWPFPTANRYSHAYEAVDLRHFEIAEPMSEAECAAVNYQVAERMNPRRRKRTEAVQQLRLPLGE